MDEEPEHAERFRQELQKKRSGLLRELWAFARHNKKWWLLPILVALALVGVLAALSASPAAPFIYPLF